VRFVITRSRFLFPLCTNYMILYLFTQVYIHTQGIYILTYTSTLYYVGRTCSNKCDTFSPITETVNDPLRRNAPWQQPSRVFYTQFVYLYPTCAYTPTMSYTRRLPHHYPKTTSQRVIPVIFFHLPLFFGWRCKILCRVRLNCSCFLFIR